MSGEPIRSHPPHNSDTTVNSASTAAVTLSSPSRSSRRSRERPVAEFTKNVEACRVISQVVKGGGNLRDTGRAFK